MRERVAYVPGSSDALTAADETLLRRQGVCRDAADVAWVTGSDTLALDDVRVSARLVG